MYKELKRKLRKIRYKGKISNYERWNETKFTIDEFYSIGNFDLDILYNRIVTLKRKSETLKLIVIPVYISIVFGIFVTLGINVISFLWTNLKKFQTQSEDLLEKSKNRLSEESFQKFTVFYDKTVNETIMKYLFCTVLIAICLVLIAILLVYVIYPMYRLNNNKVAAYQYEIEIAESKLRELENRNVKKVKYEDYIFLGANALHKQEQVSFLDYFKFLLETDFEDLERMLKKRLEIEKFPKRSREQLVEGIISTTPKELKKKRKNKNYYICNANCLLRTIRKIFSKDLFTILSKKDIPQIAIHNYEYILKCFLLDSEELCNLYANNMKADFRYKAHIDDRYIHYMSVHQILRQSLYGQVSVHSFSDMKISASIVVIRQLIEIRIRRAFGVVAYIDSQGNLIPLDVSRIFDVVKRHKKEINFPISIENIERIYKWANMYIHSDLQELSWIPYFIEDLLIDLNFGKIEDEQLDVKNGISTSKSVIDKIYEELQDEVKEKTKNIYL